MVLMPMGLFVFTNSSLLGFHSTRCSLCYAVGVVGVLEVDYDFGNVKTLLIYTSTFVIFMLFFSKKY